MAAGQPGPDLLAEAKTCSSNYVNCSIAKTTPEEDKEPAVKCGYFSLNQAARAPGYEHPIVTHGVVALTFMLLLAENAWMK